MKEIALRVVFVCLHIGIAYSLGAPLWAAWMGSAIMLHIAFRGEKK